MSPIITPAKMSESRVNDSSETSDSQSRLDLDFQWLKRIKSDDDLQLVDAYAKTADHSELSPWDFVNRTDDFPGFRGCSVLYLNDDPSAGSHPIRLFTGTGRTHRVIVRDSINLVRSFDVLAATDAAGFKENETVSEYDILRRSFSMAEGETVTDWVALNIRTKVFAIFEQAFAEAVDEVFEDGMESTFSQTIHSAIRLYGDAAISAIETILYRKNVNYEVAGEALRAIGSVTHPQSHNIRLNLLLNKLKSVDSRIRDAASLGIADLDDPKAIGGISKAIEKEDSPLLKRNLTLVLNQLRATESVEFSERH